MIEFVLKVNGWPSRTEIADDLEQAAELVRQGWVQGQGVALAEDGNVRYCMLGAVDMVTNRAPNHASPQRSAAAQWALEHHLAHVQPSGAFPPIISYNDTPGRTQEEVVETFLQCAKDLRNEAGANG
jgi:hypothetical protein